MSPPPQDDRADEPEARRRELLARLAAARGGRAPRGEDLPADGKGRVAVPMRSPAPARLALVHPSGGELFCYVPLVRALREGTGVAGFAADPRDLAAAAGAVTAVAARIAGEVGGPAVTATACLAGWSYGGVVAFEVARQLEAAGRPSPPVVLVDADHAEDTAVPDEATVRWRFVHDVARLAGLDGPAVLAAAEAAASGEVDVAAALSRLPTGVRPGDGLAARYATFRACALAQAAYDPPAPYGGTVTLLVTAPGKTVTGRWRDVCTGGFHVEDLPGDHYTVFSPPALGRVVAAVERAVTG